MQQEDKCGDWATESPMWPPQAGSASEVHWSQPINDQDYRQVHYISCSPLAPPLSARLATMQYWRIGCQLMIAAAATSWHYACLLMSAVVAMIVSRSPTHACAGSVTLAHSRSLAATRRHQCVIHQWLCFICKGAPMCGMV